MSARSIALKRRGYTILLVEQNLDFCVLRFADRVVAIESGLVVDQSETDGAGRIEARSASASSNNSHCDPSMLDLIPGYLTIGLVNGSFYALLSLGLAFDLRSVERPQHDMAPYVDAAAFVALAAAQFLGVGYLPGLAIADSRHRPVRNPRSSVACCAGPTTSILSTASC